MSLRGRFRRLERAYRGELIAIRQTDGTVKRFPRQALEEALLRNFEFLDACADGEDPPPLTEFQKALKGADNKEPWHDTFFDFHEHTGAVEDLSEP